MNHKELCLFFRIPVPLAILHIYTVFDEANESFYDIVSEILNNICRKPYSFDTELQSLLKQLTDANIEFNSEGMARGLAYLSNYAQREILGAVGIFNYKQLQAIHIVEPDTLVVTFFSDGKDSLYEQLRHRPRANGLHPVK